MADENPYLAFARAQQPPRVSIDFKAIAAAALGHALAICKHTIPGGRQVGRHYVVRNPKRADRRPGSFKVNLRTGQWADFATGDRGGDLISLWAWRYDLRQGDAARELASFLSISPEVAP